MSLLFPAWVVGAAVVGVLFLTGLLVLGLVLITQPRRPSDR